MTDNTTIKIIPFEPSHQQDVDAMLDEITKEYEASFFSLNSKKINEVYLLPGRRYWVATAEGKVVGSVGVICNENYAVLKSMFLLKAFRGAEQQVATRLLQTAMQWAAENKCAIMYLGTMAQFIAAQKFYEKQGFIKIDEETLPENFPSNTVDTVFYKKEIE